MSPRLRAWLHRSDRWLRHRIEQPWMLWVLALVLAVIAGLQFGARLGGR